MNTLTTDLDTIISESLDKPLASEKIKQFCFEIFERTKGQTIGFSSNLRYIWSLFMGGILNRKCAVKYKKNITVMQNILQNLKADKNERQGVL